MPRTYTQLYYHLVFATKHRQPSLTTGIRPELFALIGDTVREQGGVAIAVGGVDDHVHVLASLGTTRTLADVVKAIKGISSRWLNQLGRCPDHFAWQEGYSAFTVSRSVLPRVRRYVQDQEQHHRERTLQQEMVALHRAHGLDYRD